MKVDSEPQDLSSDLVNVLAGQTVELSCSAPGGNPAPTVNIYRNGVSIGLGQTVQFVATAIDNGADLNCLAQNPAIDQPLESRTVKFNVLSKFQGLHETKYLGTKYVKKILKKIGPKCANFCIFTKRSSW